MQTNFTSDFFDFIQPAALKHRLIYMPHIWLRSVSNEKMMADVDIDMLLLKGCQFTENFQLDAKGGGMILKCDTMTLTERISCDI